MSKETRQINKNWIEVALTRAVKTVAQTALSLMTVGMTVSEVDWRSIVSISAVAGLMSILTTIVTGIHDVEVDDYEGELLVDTDNGDVDIYRLDITDDFDNLAKKEVIRLRVKPNQDLRE